MNMKGIMKKFTAMVLTVGLMASLFACVPACTFAAKEINSIVLKFDTELKKDGNMEFATVPSTSDYTITQVWIDYFSEKGFSNSEDYNDIIEGYGSLLPEEERKLTDGNAYYFTVIIVPGEGVTLDPNMQVSIKDYGNMKFISDDDGMIYQMALEIEGSHIHIVSNEYESNDLYHWFTCVKCGKVGVEETHEYKGTSGYCTVCGHLLSDAYKTKITKAPETTQTVTCGGKLVLTVEAEGVNPKYVWKYGDSGSIYSSDNYANSGMKVTEDFEGTLTIENCNQHLEKFLPITCYVWGALGDATTDEINVTVEHKKDVYTPVDGTVHKVRCSCGKILERAKHTYSGDTCVNCGYVKGTTPTSVTEVTLELPDFSDKNYPSEATATAKLTGDGIETTTNGIEKITFSSGISGTVGETKFVKGTSYTVSIYPDLEYGFNIDKDLYINYNGSFLPVTPSVDLKTRTNYLKLTLEPNHKYEVNFNSNGGIGTQPALYTDEYNDISFPECGFTKNGDEFYAWEYDGKLYGPDPDATYYYKENAEVKAVWKSQLINQVSITMSMLKHDMKTSEITFSVPSNADYSIAGVTWYEDNYQEVTKDELGLKLGSESELDKTKNYNVRVTVKGNCIGFTDNPAIWLNLRNIEEFKKTGLEYLTFVLHIKGDDADITLFEPIEGMKLAQADDMKITSSILYIDPEYTCWVPDEDSSYTEKYDVDHIVSCENPYYLNLRMKYNDDAKNTVVFGRTVKVNGKECKLDGPWYNTENIRIPYEVRDLYVTVSETSDGMIKVAAPKDMKATFVMAHYDKHDCLKTLISENMDLTAGDNTVNIANIDLQKAYTILNRDGKDRVKIMVFEGENADTLNPLADWKYYKKKL